MSGIIMVETGAGMLTKLPKKMLHSFLGMEIKIFYRFECVPKVEGAVQNYANFFGVGGHLLLDVFALDEYKQQVVPTKIILVLHDGAEREIWIHPFAQEGGTNLN